MKVNHLHDTKSKIQSYANHICSSELKHLGIGIYSSGTFIREGRMMQLLRSQYGKLNMEDVKQFFQDHTDLPNSICTHICDEVPVESRSAIIFNLRTN